MAQGVGRNILLNACLLLIVLNDLPEALPAHAFTVHIDEQRRFLGVRDELGPNPLDIILKRSNRPVIERDNALLFAI